MIYLERERVEFDRTKAEFREAYLSLTNDMYTTFKAKGAIRDTGAPIHHRQSPEGMLSTAQSKCRRMESILSSDNWELDDKCLANLIEESVDIANYVLYIATLCRMLEQEREK